MFIIYSKSIQLIGMTWAITENDRRALRQNVALGVNGKLNKVLHFWIQVQPVTWEKVFEVLIKLNFTSTAPEVQDFLERVDIVYKYKGKPNFKPFKLH